MPRPQTTAGAEIYDADQSHVFTPWAAQDATDPMVIVSAEGPYLTDADGHRLIDFSSQLVFTNLGHAHPKIIAAIKDQAETLCTLAPAHASKARTRAAEKILSHLPEMFSQVMFTNGGADAVEHALRMAKLHTGRPKVLAAMRSYHGGTRETLTISGDSRSWPIDDGHPSAVHFFGPFLYRSVFHAETEEEEGQRALEHLENIIQAEGAETFAAFIMESVPGTAGIMPPPPGYLAGLREICDRYGIVMICDEVMAGFGRTGSWFAFQNYGVTPDLVTFAKGVNSGYVPLGGVALTETIAASFATRAYPGGLTYSGHPLATAAAVAAITAMEEEGTVDNAARLGREIIGPRLNKLEENHREIIGDVRGLGCFWAIEFRDDYTGRETLFTRLREAGLEVFKGGANRFHIVPPLNIADDVLIEGLDILERCIGQESH